VTGVRRGVQLNVLAANGPLTLSLSRKGRGNLYPRGKFNPLSWRWWAGLLILATALLSAEPVTAHTRSQSFSSWHIQDQQVRLSFSVQSLEATRLGLMEIDSVDLSELLVKHLASRIAVRAAGERCPPATDPQARAARGGYLRAERRFVCPTGGPVEISNEAFFDVAPSHLHYARIRVGDGRPVEYLFTNTERHWVISTDRQARAESRGTSFIAYVLLGIEHILIGADHIAFLLALLLLCRRVREVVFMVTGFTFGHSMTLSLAVLGVVTPNVPVIESLIGFTIALVAAENVGVTARASREITVSAGVALATLVLLRIVGEIGLPVMTLVGLAFFTICYLPLSGTQERAASLRPILTVLFGLIHGFGFASILMEIGLPTDRLVPALLGFNLGVEIGQLGIVATLWGMRMLVVRQFPAADYRLAGNAASAALCSLGLFWFIERAFGV